MPMPDIVIGGNTLGGCERAAGGARERLAERGADRRQVVEAITRAAVYCGFPKALNAIFVAKRVFAERGLLPVEAPAAA